jgi:predicted AlkP superfamily pyrophosphatase or phosphodiesterase
MTVVVLGIDALDPELVDPGTHPHLTLNAHRSIETIVSSTGEPSTHELWPTIITGLPPAEHGLVLEDGVSWENPLFKYGSDLADIFVPDPLQTRIGAWLLNNTREDAFRVPASYFDQNDLPTVFDDHASKPIGIPNYVTDPTEDDREHQLRRHLGDLFERAPEARGGHTSSDPIEFYESCLEMAMIRIARTRRALRSRRYELVFGYTSGLDLIGHVAYDVPELQSRACVELDEFVGELRNDLSEGDELLLVSDHGLQDGLHTDRAMVAGTNPSIVEPVESVVDIYSTVTDELARNHHRRDGWSDISSSGEAGDEVKHQLEDLGYI